LTDSGPLQLFEYQALQGAGIDQAYFAILGQFFVELGIGHRCNVIFKINHEITTGVLQVFIWPDGT